MMALKYTNYLISNILYMEEKTIPVGRVVDPDP